RRKRNTPLHQVSACSNKHPLGVIKVETRQRTLGRRIPSGLPQHLSYQLHEIVLLNGNAPSIRDVMSLPAEVLHSVANIRVLMMEAKTRIIARYCFQGLPAKQDGVPWREGSGPGFL